MFRFEEPTYLYLLLLIPVLLGLYVYSLWRSRRNLSTYGDPELLAQLMPALSKSRPNVKFGLMLSCVALFAVLLARPQFGAKLETVKREGVEVMIALDISNSMLCEDIQPSRLEKSKRLISQLVERMENDKVGLIVFAGDAFTQVPITSDYISAKMFLESIHPSLINVQGTAIAKAATLASRSFTNSETQVGRALIIITDGENHEGGVEEAIQSCTDKGIKVHVLGVGSLDGAPIPVEGTNDYRRDKDGGVIITRLNEAMCQNIAQMGGGVYVRVDNSNGAQRAIQGELDKMATAEIETQVFTEFNEQFQVFGWLILLLLVVEMLISERRNPWFDKFNLFTKEND